MVGRDEQVERRANGAGRQERDGNDAEPVRLELGLERRTGIREKEKHKAKRMKKKTERGEKEKKEQTKRAIPAGESA